MDSKKLQKVAPNFSCELYDYTTSHKFSYDKHLPTDKRKNLENDSKMVVKSCKKLQKVSQNYCCNNCGKNICDNEKCKFEKNELCCYKKDNIENIVTITNIHHDDYPNIYYTIKFHCGKEKQTEERYLTKLNK